MITPKEAMTLFDDLWIEQFKDCTDEVERCEEKGRLEFIKTEKFEDRPDKEQEGYLAIMEKFLARIKLEERELMISEIRLLLDKLESSFARQGLAIAVDIIKKGEQNAKD